MDTDDNADQAHYLALGRVSGSDKLNKANRSTPSLGRRDGDTNDLGDKTVDLPKSESFTLISQKSLSVLFGISRVLLLDSD